MIEPFPRDNHLILFETGISLPPGWIITFPEEERLFLSFADSEGFYQGFLEWCSVGFPLSDDELFLYFTENNSDNITVNLKTSGTGSNGTIILLECISGADQKVFHIALIPEDRGFFVLELQEVKQSGMNAAEVCARIASSVGLTYPNICRRTVLGLYDFHSYSSIWKWATDTSEGCIFYGFLPGWKLCTVTVAVTEKDSLEDLVPVDGNCVFFNGLVPVNNQELNADAAGRNLEEGGELYLMLKGDLNYFLTFTYQDEKKSIEYTDLLGLDEIRQFFLAAISFDGIKQ